ncbi:glycosyltransferase [Dactylosporangium sp. CA-092794]|uniref:glycosyltransferase n=1 Tax=Dactylosporangium sp. CA-092794 TaxID=3239929 RepID=UPI003D930D5D
MRILFTAVPAYGHLLPLLPLARAAHAAGDDVLVSTHATLAGTAAGLPFTPSGSALPDLLAETTRRREGRLTLSHTDFGEIIEFFVDTRLDLDLASVHAVAEAHRPDLIVGDVVDFVAPMVAAELGVPWAALNMSIALLPPVVQGFAEALERQYQARGLPPVPRVALVDAWPAFLQPDGVTAPADALPIRPQPHHVPTDQPFTPRFPGREDRPTVLFTFGTVANDAQVQRSALDSVLDQDVNVIVTLPYETDPSTVDMPRDRVLPVGFVPLAGLLPHASLVVSAGGAGSVLAALASALPLVLLPQVTDQPMIAERVAAIGAGIVTEKPEDVGTAVGLALGDERYRRAAAQAADRLNATPAPAAVRDELATRIA